MTELILIRHGETDWNLAGRYQGQSDVPLNSQGIKQAHQLAKWLQGQKIEAVFSSDLRRAAQTAEILAETAGVPCLLEPRLREIHHGRWEGMSFSDIKDQYAGTFRKRLKYPLEVPSPGGETVADLLNRVIPAIQEIVLHHPDGRVIIVAHGLSLAVIRAHYQGVPIEQVWELIPPNAQPESLAVEVR